MRKLLALTILTVATFTLAAKPTMLDTVIAFCCPETGPPLCPPDCGR